MNMDMQSKIRERNNDKKILCVSMQHDRDFIFICDIHKMIKIMMIYHH